MSEPDSLNVNPFRVLKEAIKQVPALKYALGVAGIAAAAAIVKSLVSDLRVAVFGIILMVVLMTVLVVFAKLTAIASKDFKLPALVLLWFSLLLVIAVSSLLFTSTFFNWPMKLKDSVVNPPLVPEQHSANTNTATNTYLRGVVRDLVTKQGVPNAVIELELLPGKTLQQQAMAVFRLQRFQRLLVITQEFTSGKTGMVLAMNMWLFQDLRHSTWRR
ncbi:MAG TPA: hypothetical protein VJR02_12530 [Pyrinomonadaceae bacterium]|nr:hypothetical protein [Pyrinomonadaceae bacterium]